jgi:hypothetical protein
VITSGTWEDLGHATRENIKLAREKFGAERAFVRPQERA